MFTSREPLPNPVASSAQGNLPPERPRCVRSEDLLEGRRDVLIQHGKEVYRLSHTRSGKLILTK